MAFNYLILGFLTTFSTYLSVAASSEQYNLNINCSDENATENALFQFESSSGTSSCSKRKRNEEEPQKMRLEYYKNSKPIQLELDNNTVKSLAAWERQLILGGTSYVWNDFNNLGEKYAKVLCIEAWKIQVPRIRGMHVESGLKADCSPVLLPGPSKPHQTNNRYKGYFQYADELRNKSFFPDLVRCNCAFVDMTENNKPLRTACHTKRYFYLLKLTEITHVILIPYGQPVGRKMKIVNVCAINMHE